MYLLVFRGAWLISGSGEASYLESRSAWQGADGAGAGEDEQSQADKPVLVRYACDRDVIDAISITWQSPGRKRYFWQAP